MNQMKKYFNYSLLTVFSVCIVLALYGLIVNKMASVPASWLIIPCGAFICIFLARELNSLENIQMTIHHYRRICTVMCLLLFVAQLIVAVFADFTPINDLSYVCTGARNLILDKNISDGLPSYHQDYFEVYPNNHALFIIIYLLYKIEFVFTGTMSDFLPTALNLIGLNISYILFCKCAEIIHEPPKAFVCAVRGMLFTPLFTYTSFFYTDAMAMPLVMISTYLYLNYRKSNKISFLIICGAFISIAYKIKGSSLVLLVAIFIDMAFSKPKIRDFIAVSLPCGAVCKIISETALKIMHISHETIREKSFPLIHWVMMSADGRGGYNQEDFFFTQASTNKVTDDLARLADKLSSQGGRFILHITEKISYTWENCAFMAGYFYNDSFSSRIFYVMTFFCHFTLLFSVLMGIKKDNNKTFLFRLCLFGMIVFLLIWETRCRYLVSFFLLFLLI